MEKYIVLKNEKGKRYTPPKYKRKINRKMRMELNYPESMFSACLGLLEGENENWAKNIRMISENSDYMNIILEEIKNKNSEVKNYRMRILKSYFGDKKKMGDIAKDNNVSIQRVSYLIKSGLITIISKCARFENLYITRNIVRGSYGKR